MRYKRIGTIIGGKRMKTKKLVAIFLTAVMAASAMNVTAFAGQASDSTESLKIVMKPGDLTANGSRIDTPWLNRSMEIILCLGLCLLQLIVI